jgi:hypothetical protein
MQNFPSLTSMLAVLLLSQTIRAGASESSLLDFFSSGALVQLQVGDVNIVRDDPEVNGLFALIFDGASVKEIRFSNIQIEGNQIKAIGPHGFPRLEFQLESTGDGGTKIALTRVEGMPNTRDASLLLRTATTTPILAETAASHVLSEGESGQVRIYWTVPKEADGIAADTDLGSVTLKKKP